jgi:4-amino-4-deoxy-L-arabinose transferase-like glycosyltransferase
MKIKPFSEVYFFALFILIISFPLFVNLGDHPIRLWDESRNAINALDMFSNGNYLVTHYEGNPEMWNTKPPLLIWLQVLFFTLIGPSELALRLPSAFAALGVCITLYLFSIKYLNPLCG